MGNQFNENNMCFGGMCGLWLTLPRAPHPLQIPKFSAGVGIGGPCMGGGNQPGPDCSATDYTPSPFNSKPLPVCKRVTS